MLCQADIAQSFVYSWSIPYTVFTKPFFEFAANTITDLQIKPKVFNKYKLTSVADVALQRERVSRVVEQFKANRFSRRHRSASKESNILSSDLAADSVSQLAQFSMVKRQKEELAEGKLSPGLLRSPIAKYNNKNRPPSLGSFLASEINRKFDLIDRSTMDQELSAAKDSSPRRQVMNQGLSFDQKKTPLASESFIASQIIQPLKRNAFKLDFTRQNSKTSADKDGATSPQLRSPFRRARYRKANDMPGKPSLPKINK